MKKQVQIMAGDVLVKSLLNQVDKAAYQFGGLPVKGEIVKKSYNNLDAKTTIVIPAKFIKGDQSKFIAAFERTMNAWFYKIEIA